MPRHPQSYQNKYIYHSISSISLNSLWRRKQDSFRTMKNNITWIARRALTSLSSTNSSTLNLRSYCSSFLSSSSSSSSPSPPPSTKLFVAGHSLLYLPHIYIYMIIMTILLNALWVLKVCHGQWTRSPWKRLSLPLETSQKVNLYLDTHLPQHVIWLRLNLNNVNVFDQLSEWPY